MLKKNSQRIRNYSYKEYKAVTVMKDKKSKSYQAI
jgi:hypothetical protein